jgi:flagellar motor component MotA
MSWSIPIGKIYKPLIWLVTALAVYGVLRGGGFYNFTAPEAEGLNVLIQLIGGIYAVLLAFTIFVIWGQFTEVENCVIRECNSLDDLLRFSDYLNADAHSTVRKAIGAYTRHVLNYEWASLGDGQKDQQADEFFSRVVKTVVELTPRNEAERAIQVRLLDMAQRSSECRDERVAKSLTRIPPTLAGLVNTIAGVLLLLIFVYPFHHWLAGAACFVIVAAVLFLADFVMTDTDNPLKGVWNVSPQPFSELRL